MVKTFFKRQNSAQLILVFFYLSAVFNGRWKFNIDCRISASYQECYEETLNLCIV
jgi:hypothetical protein